MVDPGPTVSGAAEQLAFVEAEVQAKATFYLGKRAIDRRRAFSLQIATVALSGTITTLLGLRLADPIRQWLTNIALVLGALLTVLAAWDAFYSHRGLWLLRSDTVQDLETLSRKIAYYRIGLAGGAAAPEHSQRFLAELEQIIARDLAGWRQMRGTEQLRTPPASAPQPGAAEE